MPEALKQNIKKTEAIPIQVIDATTEGSAIDTKLSEMVSFDTALFDINIGNITGTPTSVKVKVQESDVSDFGSGVVTAEGGDEITVSADSVYKMEIARTKRYLRAVVTIAGGTTPTVEVYVGAILWNAAKPFPIL